MKCAGAAVVAAYLLVGLVACPAAAAPEGQLTWGVHISLAPAWFDPADAPGIITPFMVFYALHDALVKPMPGQPMAPSLAESWSVSKDGLTYEFELRRGARFHDGSPVTSEDVKFSFERYRGTAAAAMKARVTAVETPDPQHVRFRLRQPWADFMTFYASPATGAAWIVPKKYVERVGDDGFKRMPVGAGPYRLVASKPGVELVLEAFDGYWRKTPNVKTLVFRVVPDEATRLAALKRGEVDVVYSVTGPLAEELKRSPGLTLVPTYMPFTSWMYPTEQWDAKSPWADKRVRQAVSLAIDREAINQASYLGLGRVTNTIIPQQMDYYWQPPPPRYDPVAARKLLAEAGYPAGFDAGEVIGDMIYGVAIGEPVVNFMKAVGIRTRLRTMERIAYTNEYAEKKHRGFLYTGSAAFGHAASRIEQYAVTSGRYAYGTVPEIDGLFSEQVNEATPRVRAQILTKIQQIMHARAMFIPVIQPAFLNGVGPRVDAHGLGAIAGFAYSAPYEDLTLKAVRGKP